MNNHHSKILLKSIKVIDLENRSDQVLDIFIDNQKIIKISNPNSIEINGSNEISIYDCKNLILIPGLFDMKVHLNGSEVENINHLQKVAAKSGILKLVSTPNKVTLLDNPMAIEHLYEKSKSKYMPEIFSYGAATRGLDGVKITELGLMSETGVVGFTDGNNCVQDSLVMRRIMSYAEMFDKPVIQHAEDKSLAGLTESSSTTIKGEVNESEISTRLGLIGIPSCAEVIIIERDLRLAKLTKAHYHVSNVSTKDAIEVIKKGKEEGIRITCDTSPPYFSLNELELSNYDTAFKLSPPLRNEEDRRAIIKGIKDGIIDAITSNHQSRSNDTKLLPFSSSSIGASGLETLLPLTLSLAKQGELSFYKAINLLTKNPAKILNIDLPKIAENSEATFIILDAEKSQIINKDKLMTSPTPFHGRPVEGTNIASFIKGKLVYKEKEFKTLKNE